MEEIISLANKLGGASFAALLLIILIGSWKGIWMWGRHYNEMEARFKADYAEMEARHKVDYQRLQDAHDWWRNIAVQATGIAEIQGHVLRVKETKELAKVDRANKRLLDET